MTSIQVRVSRAFRERRPDYTTVLAAVIWQVVEMPDTWNEGEDHIWEFVVGSSREREIVEMFKRLVESGSTKVQT